MTVGQDDGARRHAGDAGIADAAPEGQRAKTTKARTWICRFRSAVFNSTTLSSTAKLSLLALAEYADSGGKNAKPSYASLAELTGLNERTVRESLDPTVGIWTARTRRKRTDVYNYTLLLPAEACDRPARGRRADRASGHERTEGPVEGTLRPDFGSADDRTLRHLRPDRRSDELGKEELGKEELGEDAREARTQGSSNWKKPGGEAATLTEYLKNMPADTITAASEIVAFVDSVDLPTDYVRLAWPVFREANIESQWRSKNWISEFTKFLRSSGGLWGIDHKDRFYLTAKGKTAEREQENSRAAATPFTPLVRRTDWDEQTLSKWTTKNWDYLSALLDELAQKYGCSSSSAYNIFRDFSDAQREQNTSSSCWPDLVESYIAAKVDNE